MIKVVEHAADIKFLLLPDGVSYAAKGGVGTGGTYDSIRAYWENGEMGPIPWFALVNGVDIVRRINGKYVVEVIYEEI